VSRDGASANPRRSEAVSFPQKRSIPFQAFRWTGGPCGAWRMPKNHAKPCQTAPSAIADLRSESTSRRGTNVALVPPQKSATFCDIRDIRSTPISTAHRQNHEKRSIPFETFALQLLD
jgi:hypothetical protein